MKPSAFERPDPHSEEFLRSLLRRQLRLSISCAAAFLLVLFGLPLANYFFPEVMATRVFGFPLTWLLLGVGFCPVVWAIAWFFVRRSIALEEAEVREVKEGQRQGADALSAAGQAARPAQTNPPRTSPESADVESRT